MRLAILEQQKSSLDMLSEHMKSEGGKYRQLITEQVIISTAMDTKILTPHSSVNLSHVIVFDKHSFVT